MKADSRDFRTAAARSEDRLWARADHEAGRHDTPKADCPLCAPLNDWPALEDDARDYEIDARRERA